MSAPRLLDADEVHAGLSVVAAADALAAAFADPAGIDAPPRLRLPMGDATFLVMPAVGEFGGVSLAGTKLVTIRPDNAALGVPAVQASYAIFGGPTAAPLAIIDGAALTELRTSAVSALATRLLARPDAARLVIFGTGAQARAHLHAMRAVRPITEVVIVGRRRGAAEALAETARRHGIDARTGDAGEVAGADIVCTCTTSPTPLFDGATLRPGTHVNAIGAYRPDTREIDDATVERGRIVVEDRAVALAEAGDLIIPIRRGRIDADAILADLGQLCRGEPVRRDATDVTVFTSVGMAMEDLVVAAALLAPASIASARPS